MAHAYCAASVPVGKHNQWRPDLAGSGCAEAKLGQQQIETKHTSSLDRRLQSKQPGPSKSKQPGPSNPKPKNDAVNLLTFQLFSQIRIVLPGTWAEVQTHDLGVSKHRGASKTGVNMS